MLPGMLIPYCGGPVPTGYFDCDGSAVSRTTYAALFAAIGTTYGVGNGSTSFNIPDCRGRAVLGAGTGSGLTARARGDIGGAETVALANTDIPSLSATVNTSVAPGSGGCAVAGDGASVTDSFNASTPSATTLPAVMNPFAVARWLIKF